MYECNKLDRTFRNCFNDLLPFYACKTVEVLFVDTFIYMRSKFQIGFPNKQTSCLDLYQLLQSVLVNVEASIHVVLSLAEQCRTHISWMSYLYRVGKINKMAETKCTNPKLMNPSTRGSS